MGGFKKLSEILPKNEICECGMMKLTYANEGYLCLKCDKDTIARIARDTLRKQIRGKENG